MLPEGTCREALIVLLQIVQSRYIVVAKALTIPNLQTIAEVARDAISLRQSTDGTYGAALAGILSTTGAKTAIVLVYLVYLAASINYALGESILHWKTCGEVKSGVSALPLGLDLKLLAPLGSYAADELRAQERLFFDYGPYCFAVVLLRNRSLTSPEERRKLVLLYNALSRRVT